LLPEQRRTAVLAVQIAGGQRRQGFDRGAKLKEGIEGNLQRCSPAADGKGISRNRRSTPAGFAVAARALQQAAARAAAGAERRRRRAGGRLGLERGSASPFYGDAREACQARGGGAARLQQRLLLPAQMGPRAVLRRAERVVSGHRLGPIRKGSFLFFRIYF
jgi:hypothetical protein